MFLGDLLTPAKKEFGHITAPVNFLFKAAVYIIMNVSRVGNKSIIFCVCTDDPVWAKKNFSPKQLRNYFKNQNSTMSKEMEEVLFKGIQIKIMENLPDREQVLYLLTKSDHLIITIGTFGWWGAFLNADTYEHAHKRADIKEKNTVKGLVLYYKRQYKRGSYPESQFSSTDFFPSHWIGLDEN